MQLGDPAQRAGADRAPSAAARRGVSPSRATSASRGSSRGGTAAMTSPSAGAVGRSLYECTAKSISLASSASRSAETNTPTPSCGTGAVDRSPAVTISTSSTARPVRSRSAPRRPCRTGPGPARCPGCRAAGARHRCTSADARRSGVGLRGRVGHVAGRTARAAAPAYWSPPGAAASCRTRTVGECSSRCTTRCTVWATSARCSSVSSGRRWASRRSSALTTSSARAAQRGDGRRHVGAAQPGEERLDLGRDDLARPRRSSLRRRPVGEQRRPAGRCRRARPRAARRRSGVDVPRHGQVEQDQRRRAGVAVGRAQRGDQSGEHRLGRGGRAHHHVDRRRARRPARRTATRRRRRTARPAAPARSAPRLVTMSGPAPARAGWPAPARPSRRRRRPARGGRRRRRRGALAASVQRGGDHALPGAVDAGLGVHPLADPQRLLHQLVQQPAGRVRARSASRYASRSWPRICASPTTIESSPAATRKACPTAAVS